MWDRGLRRQSPGAQYRPRWPAPAGVSRIRLGRRRHHQQRPSAHREEGRKARQPGEGPGRARVRRHRHRNDGDRAHPLGHARRPDRPQRPPAPFGRRAGGGDPQRHHRELLPPARRARGDRGRVRQRHRHRVRRPPARSRGARRCARLAPRTGPRLLAEGMRRTVQPSARARSPCSRSTSTCPGAVVAARRNSPLVVGRGEGENFLASDVSAFIEHTREAIELGQDQVVLITPEASRSPTSTARPRPARNSTSTGTRRPPRRVDTTTSCSRRSPSSRRRSPTRCWAGSPSRGDIVLDEVRLTDQDLRDVDKVFIVACGTSYNAGMVAKYAIEHWVRIPCEVELASEFRYRDPVLDRSTLVIAISQSGETMDTLMALRHAKEQKARVLAICNTNGSTIPARVRRGAVHARRPGDRGRLDQGVPHPVGRLLPDRPAPGPDSRRDVRRRGRRRGQPPAPYARRPA